MVSIISAVQKAFALLNTTMMANPILLIVSLIAGLVAGFIYLWNNCESFRNFWINLWSTIQKTVSSAIEKVKNFFTQIIDFIKDKIPFRNRLGNTFMSLLFHLIYKVDIPDTQTGLRAFPLSSISELLNIRGFRYEYEQNMLIYLIKNFKNNISCININAVYNQKQVSYFKVFKDSVSIVKCLFLKSN